MEVPGLIPGTDLRPADILTSALGNAYTALDVSICSPHASEAGADCTQSRVQAKHQYYGPHLDSLLRQNISYCPVVWSAYGRPHPDTLAVLRSLSKSIARKRNVASAEVVFHRLHSSITLEIWRRTARQVRACWPTTAPLVDLDWLPSPCWGLLSRLALLCCPSFLFRVYWLCRLCPPGISVSGRTPALRSCQGCSWRLAVLAPQGLSLSVSLSAAFQFSQFLAHSALFALCPFWIVLSVVTCPALVRFVSLRPNSPCWPHSRTLSLWASPSVIGQPVLVAGLLLLFRAHLWLLRLRQHPQRPLRRPRPVMRWRPLCCVPRHSGPPLPGRALALAHLRLCRNALHGRHVAAPVLLLVCVALLPSRSRDWSRAWPPSVAHQSASQLRLSRVARALHAASIESQPPAVAPGSSVPTAPAPEAPRVTEPSSNSDDEWDALLDAHGLTGTAAAVAQRLPPLELVGVLATSVADDSARLPSAPCGGTSSPLPLPVCPPPGRCVHAGGLALALCTLSWVLSSYRPSSFSSVALGVSGTARRLWCGSWCSSPFGFLVLSVEFSAGCSAPLARTSGLAGGPLTWRSAHTVAGPAAPDLTSCSSVRRLLCGVMTKLIVRNITVLGG